MGSLSVLKQSTKPSSFAQQHGERLAAQCLSEIGEQFDTRDEGLDSQDEISERRLAGELVAEYLAAACAAGNTFVERAFLGVIAEHLGAALNHYDTESAHA